MPLGNLFCLYYTIIVINANEGLYLLMSQDWIFILHNFMVVFIVWLHKKKKKNLKDLQKIFDEECKIFTQLMLSRTSPSSYEGMCLCVCMILNSRAGSVELLQVLIFRSLFK